jgi:GNAT superfamily N-acetyltransferase
MSAHHHLPTAVLSEPLIIRTEPFDGSDAVALRNELEAELHDRYGHDSEPGAKPSSGDVLAFLVARDPYDKTPLGCGALRRVDDETIEIKRMFVRPAGRGHGTGIRILEALECEAAARGATRVVLETGDEQPEAIGLYERHGYEEIPCFGSYAESDLSRCFGKDLSERRLAPEEE